LNLIKKKRKKTKAKEVVIQAQDTTVQIFLTGVPGLKILTKTTKMNITVKAILIMGSLSMKVAYLPLVKILKST